MQLLHVVVGYHIFYEINKELIQVKTSLTGVQNSKENRLAASRHVS